MVIFDRRSLAMAALLLAGLLSLSALAPRNANATEVDTVRTEVTDLLGRKVKVHLPVRRVILGEGRQLYLVAALDTQNPIERIVGWRKDLIQSDPDTYNAYLRKFPGIAKIPTFGGFEDGTFDIEQAISQRPDVIILNIEAQHATEDARYIEKLDALGIPVVYVDFRNNPMQNTEPTMRLFGQLFGKEARAEAFIEFRNQQIRRVTDVINAQQPKRPNVFIERIGGYTDDCCLSFGNENFGLFVDMAGGNNIARQIIPTTFGQLNPEQVIVANPAHVVVTTANWEAFAPGGHWVGVGPGADADDRHVQLGRDFLAEVRRHALEQHDVGAGILQLASHGRVVDADPAVQPIGQHRSETGITDPQQISQSRQSGPGRAGRGFVRGRSRRACRAA